MSAGVQYLTLLRGINVGGKNLIRMAELRTAFEEMGFADVATYIQSGNVLFRAPRGKRRDLADRIETELGRRFGIELKVVVLSERQLRAVVDGAPREFGAEALRCDVIFLRPPLTEKRAFGLLEMREGIDSASSATGVLYYSRLAARASGSRLSKIAAHPEYKEMTIRSWGTTAKLLALMEERAG